MSINNDNYIPAIPEKLQTILQQIADDVVDHLGCIGALVATLEQDHLLPIRAQASDIPPAIFEQLAQDHEVRHIWPDGLLDLSNSKHQANLCYRAIKSVNGRPEKYLLSDTVHELFRPLISPRFAEQIQTKLAVQQVAAIPFFIDDDEVVGLLLVVARQPLSARDLNFLIAFGNQAAIAIQGQRQMVAMAALERVILLLQSEITDETRVLQIIVEAVVDELGFVGAMVATLESGNALPVRAFRIEEPLSNVVQQLEERAGISLLGPKACVYLDDGRYQENLSVRAMRGNNGQPVKYLTSDRLYDLLRPIVNRPFARLAQQIIGIKRVIAVPFFLADEVVGNLFAATRREQFSPREIELITAFGQQAAVGLRNARLYYIAEERRQIAQQFGRMAFNATVSLHSLRNYVGSLRLYLELLQMLPQLPPDRRQEILERGPNMLTYLSKMSNLLDTLHEPWQKTVEEPLDINHCFVRAFRSIFPHLAVPEYNMTMKTKTGVIVNWDLTPDLPQVYATQDMLAEAFRIFIKNALDAQDSSKKEATLWLSTYQKNDRFLVATVQDDGIGIKPEDLDKIFEMGWSTKQGKGMGFGLYWTQDYIKGIGGHISVESNLGEGTTFKMVLPVAT